MLTRRPALHCGLRARDQKPPLISSEFLGSTHRIQHSRNGDGNGRMGSVNGLGSGHGILASHVSGSGKSRASLAYVRSLSFQGLIKAGAELSAQDAVHRSVTDAVAPERLHVIPYADLVLQRKLDGGHTLVEAIAIDQSEHSWEEAWKRYMQRQTATLKELSARVQEINPQITTTPAGSSAPDHQPLPETATRAISKGITCEDDAASQKKGPSVLSQLRARRLGKRRTSGLLLLNFLAALYGSSTVAGRFATDVAPGLPASLSSLVRFSSALLVFLPALINIAGRGKNSALLKAGAELGGLLFAAGILETCGDGGASSDAPLLFAFTVIFVPIMELCAGRQSVRNITRIASLVALSGMGVLEEEGLGWKGISLPQVGDVWGLAASAIYALHIFRSEAHSKSFKPFELTAIQCGTVASLSFLWEVGRVLHGHTAAAEYMAQLQALPWGPLVYTGLVCSGLCSWLEIHGLRSVHASTATMVNTTIPIWGAFLSFFLRGETFDDSAMVGGSVILVASFFAQMVSKQDDTAANPKKQDCQAQRSKAVLPVTPIPEPAADHVQGAIITSQLKFPYYAAQAKRLLVEAKFKILSVKSLVISATSTLLTNTPPLPPGSLHTAAPTAIALQQAASAVSTGGSSLQLPSPGSHAAMAVQWLDVAAGVMESAISAVGSDMLQAVEEAEDMAKALEQASQNAMEHLVTAATSVNCFLDMANWMLSLEFIKFFDTTPASSALVEYHSLACSLPHVDAVLQILLTCPPNP